LFGYPGYVAAYALICEEGLFGVVVSCQLLFVRDDAVDALVALAADADLAVRHLFLGKSLLKVGLSVYCAGDEVVLGQGLAAAAELAVAYGAG
jgi:hypothetical protein